VSVFEIFDAKGYNGFSSKILQMKNYKANLETARRFWQGEGRYAISVYPVKHNYRQLFDMERMLQLAPLHLADQASMPGISLPTVSTDWGTISTAKYWGGKAQFDSTGGNTFINPAAQTVAQALELSHRPLDDPEMDAARSVAFYQELSRRLQTNTLWLRTPDMQGPLNTAGLTMNQEEFFRAMYSEPANVHAYLEKVTAFLVDYQRYLRDGSGQHVCGNLWPTTFFPQDLGVSFTEDLMPLLSTKLYREFGIPCLQRLAQEFGGLHIHCCGHYGHHVQTLLRSGMKIYALEYHFPETRLEELEPLADQVVFIPYLLQHKQDEFMSTAAYYRHLIENTDRKFRFWFACAEDSEELLAFARQYGSSG